MSATTDTIDPDEIARFAAMAAKWWDDDGPMRPLHKLNPTRLTWIKQAIARRFGRDPKPADALAGLTILDVGCGAGLLCEPLARMGANVVGIDPSAAVIAAAKLHAGESRLAIDYRAATAEALAAAGERFDVVLALEVVEHVTDVGPFRRHLRRTGEARRACSSRRPSTARRRPSCSPSSAPNTCCAGCRAAPTATTSW